MEIWLLLLGLIIWLLFILLEFIIPIVLICFIISQPYNHTFWIWAILLIIWFVARMAVYRSIAVADLFCT